MKISEIIKSMIFRQNDLPPEFNDEEMLFYNQLLKQLKKKHIKGKLTYTILSNKTIAFCVDGVGQIGRVKMRGKKRMQILKHMGRELEVKWIENIELNGMIKNISHWITYAKDYQKWQKRMDKL